MPSVLFLCTGNICRSPFAERYAALLVERAGASGWTFASAGTAALAGQGMEPLMAAELEDRGGDSAGFVARQLDHRVLAAADWVVTLEESHRRWLLNEFDGRMRTTVTLGRLAGVAGSLDPAVRGEDLLAAAAGIRRAADRAEAVDDPYRRGPRVAAECATRISRHVDTVAGRLL